MNKFIYVLTIAFSLSFAPQAFSEENSEVSTSSSAPSETQPVDPEL